MFDQHIAVKRDAHAVAGEVIGGHLLLRFQAQLRRKTCLVAEAVGALTRIIALSEQKEALFPKLD